MPRERRLEVLNVATGVLLAHPRRELQWLGRALQQALAGEVEIDRALGLRPPRGSRLTPEAIARRLARDRALVHLGTVCGGDRAALAALRGSPAPLPARSLVAAFVQRYEVPRDSTVVSKARRRVAAHRR